jgi:hypothetical protein
MQINGRNYCDPLARVKEIEIAVARLPMDAPLKEHFEFLIGVIDAYDRGEIQEFYEEDPKGSEEPATNNGTEVYRELEAVRP